MGSKSEGKGQGTGEWWLFIDHHGKREAKKIGNRKAAQEAAKSLRQSSTETAATWNKITFEGSLNDCFQRRDSVKSAFTISDTPRRVYS